MAWTKAGKAAELGAAALFKGMDGDDRRALAKLPIDIQEKLDAFFKEIKGTQFFNPDGNPDPEWQFFQRETWEAARGAVSDAAFSVKDAGCNATWEAAMCAVGNVGPDRARRDGAVVVAVHAAMDATEGLADEAALDVALCARYLVVSDLDFPDKEKYWQHAQDRWKVWKKGYALFSEIDGKLYVYAGKPSAERMLRK